VKYDDAMAIDITVYIVYIMGLICTFIVAEVIKTIYDREFLMFKKQKKVYCPGHWAYTKEIRFGF